jgi:hypothetical protein
MGKKNPKKKNLFDLANYEYAKTKIQPFEEYTFFADMTDRLAERRQKVHTFFEAILTALLGIIYFIVMDVEKTRPVFIPFVVIVSILGILICIIWLSMIANYKKLINLRYNVLMRMEKAFQNSVRMFTIEMDYFNAGGDRKSPFQFSNLERYLPYVFILVFVIVLVLVMIHY